MGALIGVRHQAFKDRMYDASGTITTANTPQLILPEAVSRSSLLIENISSSNMFIEIGSARAIATITNGSVTGVVVTNAGFGYSQPPSITFLGGAFAGGVTTTLSFSLNGDPGYPAPSAPASAVCVMTGTAPNMSVASITINSGGSGYFYPPYVSLNNHRFDLWGAAAPSATSGIQLFPGGSYTSNGSIATTDAISVFCATQGAAYMCKFTL